MNKQRAQALRELREWCRKWDAYIGLTPNFDAPCISFKAEPWHQHYEISELWANTKFVQSSAEPLDEEPTE